jgi:hypothetical protein
MTTTTKGNGKTPSEPIRVPLFKGAMLRMRLRVKPAMTRGLEFKFGAEGACVGELGGAGV